jgi:hypothetical protein
LGSFMYIIPILLFVVSFILTLLFLNNIVLTLIINASVIILLLFLGRRQIKKLHPFVKRLFDLYGQQEFSKKDEFLVYWTYLTTVSFSTFFYILFYSIILGKILYSVNILYMPIRLIGAGIPILYFGLHEENITSKYIKNISIMKDSFLRKKIKKFFWIMLIFSIFSFVFTIIDVLFKNLFSTLILHICIGILIFSALTWIIEKVNLKYIELFSKNENKSIDEIINIKGIGPKTIQHLKNGGITTIKKLGEIDIKDLLLIKGIRKKTARLLKEFYNK